MFQNIMPFSELRFSDDVMQIRYRETNALLSLTCEMEDLRLLDFKLEWQSLECAMECEFPRLTLLVLSLPL